MIKFEVNGNPFDPGTFEASILKVAMEAAIERVREKLESIRHPETGEFPTIVVSATSLDDIKLRIEGSPELLDLVRVRMDITTQAGLNDADKAPLPPMPKVFLSYAWEDRDLAATIANALHANGIKTWFAEWCISAGDSLRQKIDEGLGDCTHFVVLLTQNSLNKQWVNQEMDAGLMLKLQSQVRFIPLRHKLLAEQLPPLLRGILSPSVDDPNQDIGQLINDIHGVAKVPALGKAPANVAAIHAQPTGYSAAASAVAKLFVTITQHARKFDPQISMRDLASRIELSEADAADALHELNGMVTVHFGDMVWPEDELFATFDRFWMPWNPHEDAMRLATDMFNDDNFPTSPADIGGRYGWEPRRLNPAMAHLINRKLVRYLKAMDGGNWLTVHIQRTDDTRRFVKSRS